MMWNDYVYDKKENIIRTAKKGDPSNSDVTYLGKFLDWKEASDYFKECQVEK